MKQSTEKVVKVGYAKDPKKIFDEIELLSAEMIRQGWYLRDSLLEEGLGQVHLFFERDIDVRETE